MDTHTQFSAFADFRRIVSGDLKTMLLRTKEYLDGGGQEQVLIFEDHTGKQVDFNFQGSAQEVLDRACPPPPKKGPGRPRIGVVNGEVSLLPRHWEWLDRQPQKASGTLRRLVEAASKSEKSGDPSRSRIEAADRFMGSMAGNLEGFEEASRALYARKWDRFTELIRPWPEDVRDHLLRTVQPAREAGPPRPEDRLEIFPNAREDGRRVPGYRHPWQLGAADLAREIVRGRISALAAVDAHLARIRKINPKVNAVTGVFGDEARATAREIDRRRACGEEPGPLAGVPFTVKENIDVAGHATTHGVPAMSQAIPPLDAPIVRRLREAGAIPIAHTNLPDLSLRLHTSSQLYGATRSPWGRDLTPGGSSGGEGVALATGMSPLGLGNDAGGSVRIPALFNGVAALKPGYGRFPSDRSAGPRDLTLASQLIPVEGVLARSIADLHLAFRLLAGPDPRDPRVVPAPLAGPPPQRPIRVAVVSDPGGLGVHPAVVKSIEAAAGVLRGSGYEVEPADLPGVPEIAEAYGRMIMTELQQSRQLLERLLGADGQRYIELSTSLSRPVDLAGYLALTARRQGLQRDWAQFFERYPVVLGPVFTEPIVPADFDIRGLEEHRTVTRAMRLCSATSFIGVPAVSVPTGLAGGQPQGVQLICGPYREDLCLEAAARIEAGLGRLTPIDPLW